MEKIAQIICAACLATTLPLAGCAAAPHDQQQAQEATTFAEEPQQASGDELTGMCDSKQAQKQSHAKRSEETASLSKAMKAAKTDIAELAAPYGKKARIFVAKTGSNESFSFNAERKTAAASLIKLAVLAEVMAEVDDGGLSWNSSTGGSTVERLTAKMVEESDNDAANVLIDTVGMDAVNTRCKALGLGSTNLNRKMLASGDENTTSARDTAEIMLGIAEHTIASKASCKKAEGFLKRQTRRYGIPSKIEGKVTVGNKTGELNSAGYDSVLGSGVIVRHDAAIVYTPAPVVVCVLTADIGESEAHALMGKIGKVILDDLS